MKLKKAIDGGRFGRLTLGDAYVKWYRTQQYYDSGAWRGTWALDGGGALMNQAIHSVDLLTWLMGPVVEIQANTATLAHERIEVEDAVVATLRVCQRRARRARGHDRGFPGLFEADRDSRLGRLGACSRKKISRPGTSRNRARKIKAILEQMKQHKSTGGGASDPAAIGHHGHTLQFRDFVDAVKKNRPPAIDGHEGRRSVEIILGVYKAAETGQAGEVAAEVGSGAEGAASRGRSM